MSKQICYMAMPSLYQQAVSLKLKKQADLPEIIATTIAKHYDYRLGHLQNKVRTRELCFVRQLAMETIRRRTSLPLVKIGELFKRDHTTVMNSRKVIQDYLDTNYRKEEILHFLNLDY